jgi:hypothetical protein
LFVAGLPDKRNWIELFETDERVFTLSENPVAGASFSERYLPSSDIAEEDTSMLVSPVSLKVPSPSFTDTGSGMIDTVFF